MIEVKCYYAADKLATFLSVLYLKYRIHSFIHSTSAAVPLNKGREPRRELIFL